MAIDDLNYYSSWLPAWQQTDKYSSKPWCLKSKNLDIFSSSKSVKATAFSAPIAWETWVIAEEWWLVLKTDGKVYEREGWVDTLFIDPSVNFPVYPVCYAWRYGTYEDAQWGTVQDMSVAVEWDDWRSFIVFTDRSSFTYSKVKYVPQKTFSHSSNLTMESWVLTDGYCWHQDSPTTNAYIDITVENAPFAEIPISVYAYQYNSSKTNIALEYIQIKWVNWYYYDAELDAITPAAAEDSYYQWEIWDIKAWHQDFLLPVMPLDDNRAVYRLYFSFTPKNVWDPLTRTGDLYVDVNGWPRENHRMKIGWQASDWDYNGYYSYLPYRERKLTDIWEYYWMKWQTFQPLYTWEASWTEVSWVAKTRYDFVQYMWWANDPRMDIIWMIVWNENVYMIGNMKGNGYITPCDLSGGRWTPYVAYWCIFTWVENIDYLLYLVWEDRGISCLRVFNWQELAYAIWGNKENQSIDLVWVDELYKFDWRIVNWRKNLILTTKDNRIFQYWQTYGGKGWAFIHQLPSNATITWLKADENDLIVNYSITENNVTTNYSTSYQDDIPIKNYNTEWEAVYPIVTWNHLLEKEESDLYCSYILPSSSTKLEFWGMANHYHFWTFTTADTPTLSATESYKLKGASGTYALKYVETNWNQYTFRLEWDLPVQTTAEMKITDSNNAVVINYTDFNHFRKIWVIETDRYCEWEFRFHNLNNKLELPKSHSLQIMVKGKGTTSYTPELFSVDLVANQRERW